MGDCKYNCSDGMVPISYIHPSNGSLYETISACTCSRAWKDKKTDKGIKVKVPARPDLTSIVDWEKNPRMLRIRVKNELYTVAYFKAREMWFSINRKKKFKVP